MKRILIAGLGNLLRGDDGFGIRVIQELAKKSMPSSVELYEAGSAGVALAQKIAEGFDVCILVDAMQRGGSPGTLYDLAPIAPAKARRLDMHALDPKGVLALANAMGPLPASVLLMGCEPAETEELEERLSACVEACVQPAVEKITAAIARLSS